MKRILVAGILILLLLALTFIAYYSVESEPESSFSLGRDGVVAFSAKKQRALDFLPPDYRFIDYEYTIQSTALSTFHRDVTSSARLHGCRYPVYTLIIYEYGGNLMSVCPGSHRTWPYVWSRIVNVSGPPNTAVLFDSEILHAGQPNQCKPRLLRQYKICHRDDLSKLTHLQGIRVAKKEKCVDDAWTRVKRKLSYYFAHPLNHWLYPFLMQKEGEDTWTGKVQSIFSRSQFYNNLPR